jgi:hypothetical protein
MYIGDVFKAKTLATAHAMVTFVLALAPFGAAQGGQGL